MKLLFTCCYWHGLAKLRMHTNITLDIFDAVTRNIGAELRHFVTTTCNTFQTKELRRETEAHQCRALKRNINQNASSSATAHTEQQSSPLPKKFNLLIFKNHSLGDYPNQIRCYGTTDLYSTEPVSPIFLANV